jgi:hypothetical protein
VSKAISESIEVSAGQHSDPIRKVNKTISASWNKLNPSGGLAARARDHDAMQPRVEFRMV